MKKFLQAMMIMGLATSLQGWAAGNDAGYNDNGIEPGQQLQQLRNQKASCEEVLAEVIIQITQGIRGNLELIKICTDLELCSRNYADFMELELPQAIRRRQKSQEILMSYDNGDFVLQNPEYQDPEKLEALKLEARATYERHLDDQESLQQTVNSYLMRSNECLERLEDQGLGQLAALIRQKNQLALDLRSLNERCFQAEKDQFIGRQQEE